MKSSGLFRISGSIKASCFRKGLILAVVPFLVFALAMAFFCACPSAEAFSSIEKIQSSKSCCCDHETAACEKSMISPTDSNDFSALKPSHALSSLISFSALFTSFVPMTQTLSPHFSPRPTTGFSDLFLKNEILRI